MFRKSRFVFSAQHLVAVGLATLALPVSASVEMDLHIPPQELGKALKELGAVAHKQMLFKETLVNGRRSPELNGHYTLDDAFDVLLKGSSLKVEQTPSGVLLIKPVAFREEDRPQIPRPIRLAAAGPQPAAEPQALVASADDVSEVVITATRREEVLSKVPISVQALTNAQMENSGVRDVKDIERLTPALHITESVSAYGGITQNTAIRGISSNAGQPTTGVYIDDTPVQPISGSGTVYPLVFDLERVEVLRGPQGTLFGSGSEGGAIRFIQAQPSLTSFSGYTRGEGALTQGHAASYEGGFAFGGPIVTDRLGFRVNAYYRRDGGWISYGPLASAKVNDRTGKGLGAAATLVPEEGQLENNRNWRNTKVFHAALKFAATDDLSITPSFFYQRQDFGYPGNSFWLSGSNPDDGFFYIPKFIPAPTGSILCSGPTCVMPNPTQPKGLSEDMNANTTMKLSSVNVQWNLGDIAQLNSTTSYSRRGEARIYDANIYYSVVSINQALQPFPLPGTFAPSISTEDSKVFSEELRLSGSTSWLNWQAGVYFANHKQHSFLLQTGDWGSSIYFFGQKVPNDGPPFGPGYTGYQNYWGTPLLEDSGGGVAGTYYGDQSRTDKQTAGFAQIDIKFNPIFSLTAGIRYTRDTQDFTLIAPGAENNINVPGGAACPTGPVCPYGSGAFAPEFSQGTVHESAKPVTPKFGVNAQLTSNNLVYASATKGFRIGGAQLPKPADCAGDLAQLGYVDANGKAYTPEQYSPDYVWSYEVGTKNSMAGGKFQVNASGYQIKWKDIQTSVSLSTCGYGLIVNTGSATVKGFDLEMQFSPFHGLQFRSNVGFTDTSLDDGLYQPLRAGQTTPNAVYARGSAVPGSAAPWNVFTSVRYEFPLMDDWRAYAYADDTWNSAVERTGRNDPKVYNFLPYWKPDQAFNTASLRFGVARDALDVSLFVNNLLNARPLFYAANTQLRYLWNANTIRPRVIGITASYRF